MMHVVNASQASFKLSRPTSCSLALPRHGVSSLKTTTRHRSVHAAAQDEHKEAEPAHAQIVSSAEPTTGGAVAITPKTKSQDDSNPFLDPLVRSLLLGVGAGILCETVHVFSKAVFLAENGALPGMFSSGAFQQFSPAYIADHAVAIGAWLLLYTVEAAAIMSIMRRNPGKPSQELTEQLSGLPTLPRKMFPAAWTPMKEAVALTLAKSAAAAASDTPLSSSDQVAGAVLAAASAGEIADAQAIASAAPQQLVAAPPGLSKELKKTLDDIEAAAAGRVKTPTGPIKPKEHLKKQRSPKPQTEEESAQEKRNRRDKELRERKMYLKNFWYAAALSEKVQDKPVGVDILGTRITLFRDENNKVVAVDDTCPHRGAPLGDGWTVTDKKSGKKCVVCPYHGWAFDADGKLRDVPSAEHGSWPKRPIIGAYDVEERGGFVWLFYGSKSLPKEERPPIPFTPELEDGKWRAVYGEIEFNTGHWAVFENAIDMAHIHYLHADSFGNSEKPKVMDMQSKRDTWETSCNFRIHNKPMNKLWEWTQVPSVPVTAKAMLPSTSAVHIELAHGVKMITFVNTVPINENKAINRFCLIRNFALNPAFDFMARDNMYKILGEDKVMVDKLAPERLNVEYSLAPDMPQIAFRQLRQEWIDMGYGVPTESEVPRRGLLPDC